jgi:hypothetical protein
MAETTPLDLAQMAADEDPADDAARLRFWGILADAELFVLTEGDAPPASGEAPRPQVFDLSEGRFVMAFDREDRLAAFAGAPAPYAAMPGRVLARALAGQGVGMGLNLGVAPSEQLLPAEALAWLAAAVDGAARGGEAIGGVARPEAILPPGGAAHGWLPHAAGRLSGLPVRLWFAAARWPGGEAGPVLVVTGAPPGSEGAIAQAIAEAKVFAGAEDEPLDVAFAAPGDPLALAAAAAGQEVAVPAPEPRGEPPAAKGPGTDPDRPPRLR